MDKNKVVIRIGLIAGIGALVLGLFKFYQYQIRQAMSYCYKIANIQLAGITKDMMSFRIFVKVQNKSSFALLLSGYDLDVFVNSLRVANITSVKEETIQNNAISDLTLLVNFKPSDIFKSDDIANLILFFLTDKSKIVIAIQGKLYAKMNFIKIKLPMDFKMTLKDIMATDTASEAKKTICDIK